MDCDKGLKKIAIARSIMLVVIIDLHSINMVAIILDGFIKILIHDIEFTM